ncbi:MAG: hypothetical protein F4X69_15855 [Gemmatimonadetes bacterium]|nr:hypothetical protein [Gemmatimonadota bacterium]
MKPLLLAVLIAAVTLPAAGQEKQPSIKHLKKSDPDVLFMGTSIDNSCPGTERSYERIVEGEMLRARIKRTSIWNWYEIALNVNVSCHRDRSQRGTMEVLTYSIFVTFLVFYPVEDPAPDELDFRQVVYLPSYVGSGLSVNHDNAEEERVIHANLRNAVTNALTDYLKANFSE